jgi:hypothetical protein
MFPNLEAEQARNGHTNESVAKELGLSRQAYEIKKKKGGFKFSEIKQLLAIYNTTFDYLFAMEVKSTPEPQAIASAV